ncbi:MAG: hypothetical protein ACLR9W_08060 [Enterobacter hormaechei]
MKQYNDEKELVIPVKNWRQGELLDGQLLVTDPVDGSTLTNTSADYNTAGARPALLVRVPTMNASVKRRSSLFLPT